MDLNETETCSHHNGHCAQSVSTDWNLNCWKLMLKLILYASGSTLSSVFQFQLCLDSFIARFFNFNFINFYSFAIQNINSLKHCQWIYLKFCEIKNFQWSLIFSNILDYLDNKVHPNLFVQPRIVPSEYRGPAVLYFEVILFLVPSEAEFGVW